MDSSVSLEDRIWFLRVCHHVPFSLYLELFLGADTTKIKSVEYFRSLADLDYPTFVQEIITQILNSPHTENGTIP